jgi:hypothetical protein
MRIPEDLQPGDHLLYGPTPLKKGLLSWMIDKAICVKTWSYVCHIEIHVGHSLSVASRNGIGVNQYPFRLDQLTHVLRPYCQVNMFSAMEWFNRTARGQKYDFKGLMCFYLAAKRGDRDRMFCSEFAARWDRHAAIRSFTERFDADKIAPGNYLMSPAFEEIYNADADNSA